MSNPNYTDEDLINMIRGNSRERDTALKYLFFRTPRLKNIIKSFVLKGGGKEHDLDEVYARSIIVFDNHIRNFKYEGHGKLETFFVGICKKQLWGIIRKRRNQKQDPTDDFSQFDSEDWETPEVIMIEDEKKEQWNHLLSRLDEKCAEILRLYLLGYKNSEIAETLKFSSKEVAKKASYRCRKKLKEIFGKKNQL